MQCNRWVIRAERRSKGNGKPYLKVVRIYSGRFSEEEVKKKIAKRKTKSTISIEKCTGQISVSVVVEDEPYMGGTYGTMVLTTKCNQCGSTYFDFNKFIDVFEIDGKKRQTEQYESLSSYLEYNLDSILTCYVRGIDEPDFKPIVRDYTRRN